MKTPKKMLNPVSKTVPLKSMASHLIFRTYICVKWMNPRVHLHRRPRKHIGPLDVGVSHKRLFTAFEGIRRWSMAFIKILKNATSWQENCCHVFGRYAEKGQNKTILWKTLKFSLDWNRFSVGYCRSVPRFKFVWFHCPREKTREGEKGKEVKALSWTILLWHKSLLCWRRWKSYTCSGKRCNPAK